MTPTRTGNRRPLVIGHRGASGYRPEHTRGAYELAFALGADAVEPDIVATRDGVLVIRHENEISGTTDVKDHPEFASRRVTKCVDGVTLTGWFTEDFTWAELSTLRSRERLPGIRRSSATFDGLYPILRLRDLMEIIDAEVSARIMVAEIKHASYFESIGLPLPELFAAGIRGWATDSNLIVESFEQTALEQVRTAGIPGRSAYLVEATGAPADLVARDGSAARSYAAHITCEGLRELCGSVEGVSIPKSLVLDDAGVQLVERAHAAGLDVFTWTLRAENRFLAADCRRGARAGDFGDWAREFRGILDSGVDGVFTDQPDLVVELLGSRPA